MCPHGRGDPAPCTAAMFLAGLVNRRNASTCLSGGQNAHRTPSSHANPGLLLLWLRAQMCHWFFLPPPR